MILDLNEVRSSATYPLRFPQLRLDRGQAGTELQSRGRSISSPVVRLGGSAGRDARRPPAITSSKAGASASLRRIPSSADILKIVAICSDPSSRAFFHPSIEEARGSGGPFGPKDPSVPASSPLRAEHHNETDLAPSAAWRSGRPRSGQTSFQLRSTIGASRSSSRQACCRAVLISSGESWR